jgi:hypothetical protein
MFHSTATVTTLTPRRYLVQLCKHFEHRLEVSQTDNAGRIVFPVGICALQAAGDTLELQACAATQDALAQLQDVVARHLLRFAFRDPPAIAWQPGAPA